MEGWTAVPLGLLMLTQALRDTALPGHPLMWLEPSVVDEMEDEDKENTSASGVADAGTSSAWHCSPRSPIDLVGTKRGREDGGWGQGECQRLWHGWRWYERTVWHRCHELPSDLVIHLKMEVTRSRNFRIAKLSWVDEMQDKNKENTLENTRRTQGEHSLRLPSDLVIRLKI